MASSQRARAVVIATGILVATPAAAQAQDSPPPPPAAKADAATEKPKPPPPARPMSSQPPNALLKPPPPPPPIPEARPRGKRVAIPAAQKRWKRGRALPALEGLPIVSAPAFFRLDDGSTRISVECGAKVDIQESHPQGRLVYRLRNARVMERTNQLPLMTGFFATPVERAQLAQVGTDVDLVIELREGTTPAFRAVETPRGIVIQVDFPKTVAAAERAANRPESSGQRARRRTQTTSLGVDQAPDDGNQKPGN